jgi:hypothetical protein
MSGLAVVALSPATTLAQSKCPPEVASAKAILIARGGDMEASRSQEMSGSRAQSSQSSRSQDVHAQRNQDVQAPRNQDVQAPRNQDAQAPRSQDVQAPRSQDARAQRSTIDARGAIDSGDAKKAQALVNEAEAACKMGDSARASEKAHAALDILKR